MKQLILSVLMLSTVQASGLWEEDLAQTSGSVWDDFYPLEHPSSISHEEYPLTEFWGEADIQPVFQSGPLQTEGDCGDLPNLNTLVTPTLAASAPPAAPVSPGETTETTVSVAEDNPPHKLLKRPAPPTANEPPKKRARNQQQSLDFSKFTDDERKTLSRIEELYTNSKRLQDNGSLLSYQVVALYSMRGHDARFIGNKAGLSNRQVGVRMYHLREQQVLK